MKNTAFQHCFRLYLALALVLTSSVSWAAEAAHPSLPDWQKLEYEQSAFFATAKSSLELVESSDETANWTLMVQNSVVDNSENILLEFNPANGKAITRTRLSSGEDKRYKVYKYAENGVHRERREPGQSEATEPEDWEITSKNLINYPPHLEDEIVTGPYALIALASQLIQESKKSLDVIVHTDFNFYNVEMASKPWISLDVEYEVDGVGEVRGKRSTIAVGLKISPLEESGDASDFSLLGLQDGYIILSFDKETGVLLQLRGEAALIGTTEINLKKVYPRSPNQ